MILHAAAIFLSALLLFEVQPIVARMLLPRFGGSAAVWTTCLLFFQTGLLAGYFHAWWTGRFLSPRARALLHAALLGGSLLTLPIAAPAASSAVDTGAPIGRLLLVLVRTIGLPYVLLASTGPLLQDWFSARFPARDPYRLFALSNLASLLGLLAYPFLVEPRLGVLAQARSFSVGYVLFVLLVGAVALGARNLPARRTEPEPEPEPEPDDADAVPGYFHDPAPAFIEATPGVRALWVLLPASATMLLLALTTHLTEDVAAIPLLWVLPLSVYLMTFIIAFDRHRLYRRPIFRPLVALGLPGMAWLRFSYPRPRLPVSLGLWSLGLFIACMALHGELSRLKPRPRHLTAYYLSISLGGALGGLFCGVVAPLIFSTRVELEIALVATGALVVASPFVRGVDPVLRASLARSPLRAISAAGWVVALAVALVIGLGDDIGTPHRMARNFYGALRTVDEGAVDKPDSGGVRKLLHGTTNHGAERLRPERALEPLTYYCAPSGVGLAMVHHHADRPRRLGVIGLGAGSLAAWGKPGDALRYYEINPLVEDIARTEFTYLARTPATVSIVHGDARLSLLAEEPNRFDVLVVDAFSGDAIPVHLVTREAFALYARHLADDGILAVHISNRYLDLEPVVAAGAASIGRAAELVESDDSDSESEQPGGYCFKTSWVLVGARAQLDALCASKEVEGHEPLPETAGFQPWTDDYSNVVSVLRTR